MLDGFAILYLYLMLVARTDAPFWPSIGWREMRPGAGKIRDSALQFLAGGAVLALVVSFAGGFLNSKETLPIEELLQGARQHSACSAYWACWLRRWWKKRFFAAFFIR